MDKREADFSGWATRNDLVCTDGRTIRHDAFKDSDGKTVPLVWNHQHNAPDNILGHALLENRDDGVYAYCFFNDTEASGAAKKLVKHGDIQSLSIYANQLKQKGGDVLHGVIREVSLVLAGANPGAFIDYVMAHGDDEGEALILGTGEPIYLLHSDEGDDKKNSDDDETVQDVIDSMTDKQKKVMYALIGAAIGDEGDNVSNSDSDTDKESSDEETVQDVIDTMNDKQKKVMYALIGAALEGEGDNPDEEDDKTEGGNDNMKHNVFDNDDTQTLTTLTHSDMNDILDLAKNSGIGSWKRAVQMFVEDNKDTLAHGIDDIEQLFPDHEWTNPGAPEMITDDQTWIANVLNKTHKSPISRVRMRWADLRKENIRAMGYTKEMEKKLIASFGLISRSFDPQTVYVKDKLNRDDIIDITDFDYVEYLRKIMRMTLNEELAIAIMIGDGRDISDEDKIKEAHIHSIWNDDDLFTIHADVDIEAARREIQGTNTGASFGENYIYAEAIITAALYAREKYKGSGALDFYCTPHLLNVMLLARDMNGRRIYNSKADLAAALNVNDIYTVEQFENKVRTTEENKKKKLLGLFVNLRDYQVGSTKGGKITNFDDFDIDFNQYKYLMETRLSGALTRVFSAIALEEDVTPAVGSTH